MLESISSYRVAFIAIIVGLCFVPALFTGVYRSLNKIWGYSNEHLLSYDRIVVIPIQLLYTVGMCSLLGGLFALHPDITSEMAIWRMSIGGMSGVVLYFLVKNLIHNLTHRSSVSAFIGAFIGGVGGSIGIYVTEPVIPKSLFVTVIGGIAGVIVGLIFLGQFGDAIKKSDAKILLSGSSYFLFISLMMPGFFAGALLGQGLIVPWGVSVGSKLAIGFLIGIGALFIPIPEGMARIVAFVATQIFILLRHRSGICSYCLKSIYPLQSRYKNGTRYCEHCDKEVTSAQPPEKLQFAFGEFPEITPLEQEQHVLQHIQDRSSPLHLQRALPTQKARRVSFPFTRFNRRVKGKVLLLSNPGFDEQEMISVDVSEVYIDTKTCDRLLLERFLTYIVNYPPKQGLGSIHIFYKGALEKLGENLKNALQNTFQHVEQLQ